MKIFFGTEEIASMLTDLSAGMRALGHDVHTCVRSTPRLFQSNLYDELTDIVDNMHLFRALQATPLTTLADRMPDVQRLYDYFHGYELYIFQFGRSYVGNLEEIAFLKSLGKKVFCIFNGSDVRVHHAMIQFCEDVDFTPPPMVREMEDNRGLTMNQKLNILRLAEQSADAIWGSMGCLQLAVRPFFQNQPALQTEKFHCRIPDRKRPVILHAPTAPRFKGTEIVEKTMADLEASGYVFEYRRIDRIQNHELLPMLRDADIVIDQLFNFKPAKLAAESMISGCAVVTGLRPDIVPVQGGTSPVVAADADRLGEQVARLITDRPYRRHLAESARAYALEKYDHVARACAILDSLDRASAGDFDVHPDFYLNSYKPRPHDPVDVRNKEVTRAVLQDHRAPTPEQWTRMAEVGLV